MKMKQYEKGLGIKVGTFKEEELIKGIDKIEVTKAKEKYNLLYTNTKVNRDSLTIWVCTAEDIRL